MGSSSSRNFEENAQTIATALNAISTLRDQTQLNVTSKNGSSLSLLATLLECEKFVHALGLDLKKYLNLDDPLDCSKMKTKKMEWGTSLAIELNFSSIDDYINCVKLITCRYKGWEQGLIFDNRERYFKLYCEELKPLINQYHRGYDISKPQFSTPICAIFHYIKFGERLRCSSLEGYIKRAQEGYEKGCRRKKIKLPDRSVRFVYINWNTEGVYCVKNKLITIEEFYAKRNHFWMLLYKKWPVVFVTILAILIIFVVFMIYF